MKLFVCIKQVPDTETKIRLRPDGQGIDESGIKWIMNPYDEYAVEEALKIKEGSGGSAQVIALTVGPKSRTIDALRTALAMGADEAISIDASGEADAFLTGQAIAQAIQSEGGAKLILTGKLSIDDNGASVSQYVAEFLGVPHTTVVSKLDLKGEQVVVERETEGGTREVVQMAMPCVVAANKGLNTPRYASLPGIMKAKKKPVKELTLGQLGLEALKPKIKFTNFKMPPEKPAVKMIPGDPSQQARELARLLMEDAKVL